METVLHHYSNVIIIKVGSWRRPYDGISKFILYSFLTNILCILKLKTYGDKTLIEGLYIFQYGFKWRMNVFKGE